MKVWGEVFNVSDQILHSAINNVMNAALINKYKHMDAQV
jgi:hypothetical protein